jgi:hypothetical protein
MVLVLVTLGLLLEVGLAAYVVVLTHQERKMLRELVTRSAADFSTAVDDLPEPHRTVGRKLSDHLAMEADFDDALSDAVVEVTRLPFKKPLWMRLTVGALCSLACLAPTSYGLIATASHVVTTWSDAQALDRSMLYLRGQTDLEIPFLVLREAFRGSALLFFGLAFLWALAWYLRRPEVREARFVRALLEAAARSSPKSAAPVSGRLAELIAPDRGLGRPITALVICLGGITAGWLVLHQTADVRAANDREPVFRVWPLRRSRLLAIAPELQLPHARAGAPVPEPPPPSLMITPEKVTLGGGKPLVDLPGGELPEGWEPALTPEEMKKLLDPAGGRLVLLAHGELSLDVVLELMELFHAKHRIERFDLILERWLDTGEPGGRVLQASMPLLIRSERDVGLQLRLEATGIRLADGSPLESYEDGPWKSELSRLVREKKELLRDEARALVKIDVGSRELTYGRLVEVMGAADTACMAKNDCGLPGLGLEFTINPAAPSR